MIVTYFRDINEDTTSLYTTLLQSTFVHSILLHLAAFGDDDGRWW